VTDLIQERMPTEISKLDYRQYQALEQVSVHQQQTWLVQDAIVRTAPQALYDAFTRVNDEFLEKDVVRTVQALCVSDLSLSCHISTRQNKRRCIKNWLQCMCST
jgi:hypothetical protein